MISVFMAPPLHHSARRLSGRDQSFLRPRPADSSVLRFRITGLPTTLAPVAKRAKYGRNPVSWVVFDVTRAGAARLPVAMREGARVSPSDGGETRSFVRGRARRGLEKRLVRDLFWLRPEQSSASSRGTRQ